MIALSAFEPSQLSNFPPEAKEAFRVLVQEPVGDLEGLKAACLAHAASFEEAARSNEFVSVAEARRLCALCIRMIDALDAATPDLSRRLVWATARYFVHSHDADYDFNIAGLDDDLAVANAIACYLGHPEWCIPP
jgi:hypothetical protein